MTSNLSPRQIAGLVDEWMCWLEAHRMEHVLQFLETVNGKLHTPETASEICDANRGAAILAAFTSKAAMRKAVIWLQESASWDEPTRAEFRAHLVGELADARLNCDAALYQLGASALPTIGIIPPPTSPAKGGGK